jgi:hypothetical protein
MRLLPIVLSATVLAACGREPPAAPRAADANAAQVASTAAAPAPAPGSPGGSLRVDAPAAGTISFQGFGPAAFGADAEQVRMAWGGDLGDAQPDQPGGCHYLIPQPLGTDGYRTAFMIEGDRFVRIDVRRDDVAAPGGGKVGMTKAQIGDLYPDRVEELPHKYSAGQYLRIRDPAGGPGVLVFETDGTGDAARVDAWRVGLPPQVDYVEGCS